MNTKNELKNFFENGDVPNQDQYWSWMDSYWHKEETIDPTCVTYSNDESTEYAVGGIPAGTRFSNMPVRELLDFILYGKQQVTITITTTPQNANVNLDFAGSSGLGESSMTVYQGAEVHYRVGLEGYIEKSGTIKVNEDMTVHVTLDPEV